MSPQRGRVVAFYSFKGGTGRSMALANVACLLAKSGGGRVLVIDWDLEAPGLHRYFGKQLFSAFRGSEKELRGYPGLIDLMGELRDGLGESDSEAAPTDYESAAALVERVPIAQYVIETDRPNLDLIKAGRLDEDYAGTVSAFDWQGLYRRSPHLLRALSDRLARDYAWVLIDSRTGLTDTSGICTMLMPEALVVVFTPNAQSLDGVVDLVRDAGRYRAESDDLRPLVVYPLPSRIEASEPALRKLWRFGNPKAGIPGFQPAFEQVFKDIYKLSECRLGPYFDDVQIQHVPKFAYGEDIAVLREESSDRFSLTRSFQRFTQRLTDQALPWEDADLAPVDEEVQSEEVSSLHARVSGAIREQASEALDLTSRAISTQSTLELALSLGAVMLTSTLAALLGISDPAVSRPVLMSLSLLAAVAVALRMFLRPQSRAEALKAYRAELGAAYREFEVQPDSPEALAKVRKVLHNLSESQWLTGFRPVSPSTKEPMRDSNVFICYRREDRAYAGRLYDGIVAAFGEGRVFMDSMDIILPGQDFARAISDRVARASTMLVVIGPGWREARDSAGSLRIDNPSDFVHLEIAQALSRSIRVVPVLVDGARIPTESELPPSLQSLARRQAVELSSRRWQSDLARLLADIDPLLAESAGPG